MEKQILSTKEAAAIIGCSPSLIRARMALGEWDIGTVILPSRKTGRKNRGYTVSRPKLNRLLGILQDELENERKEAKG